MIFSQNWKEMTMNWLDGPIRFITSAPVRLFVWTAMGEWHMSGGGGGGRVYNPHIDETKLFPQNS